MGSTKSSQTRRTWSPVGAPAGHKTATLTSDGIRCACGQPAGDRAQLAAHLTLAAWGVR